MGSKKLTFVDIFSGAGGLSCGFELAGCKCLLGIDHNKDAIETFKLNHKAAQAFCGPIEELSNNEIDRLLKDRAVDIVIGGPPCQGFSTVGKGDPNDQRNRLFLEYLRIVRHLKPNFIVIENVTGLLAKKNEATLKKIFQYFQREGYTLDVQVLSAHHFGVAEKRRRTIIIGSRINKQVTFPVATHDIKLKSRYLPPVTVGEVLSNLRASNGEIYNHDLEAAAIKNRLDAKRLKRIPEGRGIRYQKDEKELLTPSLYLGIDWENIRENRLRQTKYFRLHSQLPSPTIMTHRHSYYHPHELRFLTQREAAAIQSFPNDFIFTGAITSQWRQIGNAVPPLLGRAIAQAIKKMNQQAMKESSQQTEKNKIAPKKISTVRKSAFVYR
jgi:DNA (cytosine-5)-methyltransferase 1